jgi:hypothetical protein
MSYSLSLRDPPVRRTAEVLTGRLESARCAENPDGLPDVPWPTGILHFYLEGISTRGIEVIFEDGELRVRLVALACPEDWALAYDFLSAFSGDPEAIVHGEDGVSGPCGRLSAHFAEVMIHEIASAVSAALALGAGSEILQVPGPVRAVTIGPRFLGSLPTDPAERASAIFDSIRAVQYPERNGYEVQSSIPLSAPGVPTLAVWSPARAQAFEPVDAVGLSSPSGNLYIPVAQLPELVGDKFRWLDERRFAIDSVTDPGLFERAKRVSIDPYKRSKKWWQFWRAD